MIVVVLPLANLHLRPTKKQIDTPRFESRKCCRNMHTCYEYELSHNKFSGVLHREIHSTIG